jgi:hypothetical protein
LKRLVLLFGALGLGLVFGVFVLPDEGALTLGPTRVDHADGLVVLRSSVFRGNRDAGTLVALYADLDELQPVIIENDGKSLSELAPDAAAVVNGSFFTPEARPTGLLVSEGERIFPFVPRGGAAGSGVLTISQGQVALHPRSGYEPETASFAIQAGPRILEPSGDRGIKGDDGSRANRTAIGASVEGRLAIAVVHDREGGHSLGLTLFELQRVFELLGERHPELGWTTALNLDGGASTGLWVSTPNVRLRESTPVPFAIALRARSTP